MVDESGESGPWFPAERLRAYRLAAELQDRLERHLPRMYRMKAGLAGHVDRAVASLVLNTAEGATEFSLAEKRRFYRIALRSGGEAAAGLRFFARRLPALVPELAALATIMAMLTRLCVPQPPRPRRD